MIRSDFPRIVLVLVRSLVDISFCNRLRSTFRDRTCCLECSAFRIIDIGYRIICAGIFHLQYVAVDIRHPVLKDCNVSFILIVCGVASVNSFGELYRVSAFTPDVFNALHLIASDCNRYVGPHSLIHQHYSGFFIFIHIQLILAVISETYARSIY